MKTKRRRKSAPAAKPAKLGACQPHALSEIAGIDRAVAAKRAATAAAKTAPKKTAAPKTGKPAKLAEKSATETSPRKVAEAAADIRVIKLHVDKNPRRDGTGRCALLAIIMACDGAVESGPHHRTAFLSDVR